MPKTNVIIYQERGGQVPLMEWLDGLFPKARDKCIVKVELLREKGHKLRRPHCDILEQGIYELRARIGSVHYRILYAFVGKNAVLLSHGCTKERMVSKSEIDRAVKNRDNYIKYPKAHIYLEEL
jgi:hypothetical protein